MGSTSLSATVRHAECLDGYWTGREFVCLDEGALRSLGVSAVEKFFLAHVPSSSKSNEDERYVHSLEFRAGRDLLLSGVYFCDAVSSGAASAGKYVGNSYDVKFFGTLDEFVQRFNDVLSYRGLSSRFSVSVESGVVGTTESKEIAFDSVTLAEALRQAVDVWEVPYYFLGDSAVFGSADSEPLLSVEYGHDRELLRVSMSNRGEKIVTRIAGSGGEQNVPYYYPNPSPKGTLTVGGTASGVSVSDMPLFARRVGEGDVLVYEGKDASFGSVTLHFGGYEAVSSAGSVTAVVDGDNHGGVTFAAISQAFDASIAADLSGGFDRSLTVFVSALLGSASGIDPDTLLYHVKKPYGSFSSASPDCFDVRRRDEVSAKGWTPAVDRVELVAGGVTLQLGSWEGLYAEREYDESDAGLYPERVLTGVRIDLGAALALLPAGTSLSSCVIRLVGALRAPVSWDVPRSVSGGVMLWPADFHVASLRVTSQFDPAGWYNGDECIGQDLSEVGLQQTGTPVEGTTITQVVTGFITPTGRLMPSVYRTSGGTVRSYDALDGTYVDPETGNYYDFENEYDALNPHEHVEDFDDVYPTIRNLKDGQGNPLNVLQGVYFDPGYNVRDLLPDGETLKYNHFFVKLKPLGFNLFDCAIEGGEMALVMSDGPCAGCHFKIWVTSTGKNPVHKNQNGTLAKDDDGYGIIDGDDLQASQQDTTSNAVWVALFLDDSTFGGGEYGTMPAYDEASDVGPKPVTGDSYTVENIMLPQAFFTAAEEELDRRLIRFMWENNADKFDPSVVFSRVYLAENPSVRASLSERSRLSLTYDGRVYAPLYVSQFTLNVKEGEPLPEILVETADVVEPRSAGLDERISRVATKAVNAVIGGAGGGVDFGEADKRYLRKDAEDVAEEKIIFRKGIEIGDYRAGLQGLGGTIYTNAAGEAIAEVDFLNVRRKATFTEVEVEQIRKVAGTILLSLADLTVTAVEKVSGGWKCWFRTDTSDGSSVENGFSVNDQAICRKLQSTDDHYYWRLVTSVGPDWIVLSESDCDAGSDAPRVGDVIVQLGNRSDASRQSAQILSCYGEDSPSYVIYAGINSYSLSGKDISGFVYRETSSGSGVYQPYFFNYGSMLLGDRAKTNDYVEYDNGTGALTIKANVIFKAGQTIPGLSDLETQVDNLEYLHTALPESDTIISGGLILSKVIALRDSNNAIKSGINGDPTLSSIAAWYGGPMADKEATPTPASYAQSLFRFDGSGYLAGGNIGWENDGDGHIPGISWETTGGVTSVTIGANVKLEQTGGTDSSVTDLVTAVQSFPSTYLSKTDAATLYHPLGGSTTLVSFKIGGATLTWHPQVGSTPGYIELDSALVTAGDQIVVSGDPQGGGGGGGGATMLRQLEDVYHNAISVLRKNGNSVANGDLLSYDSASNKWVALDQSTITPDLSNYYTKTQTDTQISSAITALNLGAASTYGVGTVTSGNGGLVTGGSVYSAINEAVSSVLKMQGTTTTAISDGSTTNPIVIDGSSYTAKKGDVVMYSNKEFWWTGSAWEELGDEASWALKTTTITAGTGLTGGGTLAANRTISLSQATQDSLALANTALQSHQTIYALTIKNSAGTTQLTYTPNSGTGSITLTKAMVGLGDVDNLAAADYFTALTSGSTDLLSITIGGTTKKLTTLYASRLTTVSKTIWGQTYWTANGVPQDVTAAPNLYIGTTKVQVSSAAQALTGITSITASGLIKTTNYVQATRFYLTDSIYFYTESVDGTTCVRLNAPFITSGDQIVISGTPGGGGGGGGATSLYQLEDVYHNASGVRRYSSGNVGNTDLLGYDSTKGWYAVQLGTGLSMTNGVLTATNTSTGTVTQVKVGNTAYNPTDGVVSLPAYPTTLPASDVSAWAKASTKPSYAFSEITGTASASQIPSTVAYQSQSNNFVHSTNEWTVIPSGYSGNLWLNYRTVGGANGSLTNYSMGNGASGYASVTASSFIKNGGTSSQFLKADGSVDSNTYLTGITSTMVTTALGYTPANSTALSNYVLKAGDTMTGILTLNHTYANPSRMKFVDARVTGTTGGWADVIISIHSADEALKASMGWYGNGATPEFVYFGFADYYGKNLRIYPDGTLALGNGTNSSTASQKYDIYHQGNLTKSVLTTLLESSNGYYVKKSGDTMSGALTVSANFSATGTVTLGSTSSCALYLNRASNPNYIWAANTGGYLAFGVADKGTTNLANSTLVVNAYGIGVGGNTSANSTAALNVTGNAVVSGSVKIGSATITWNSNGYLHIDKPLVTAGDQIVISGTPGGGGGGGATTLAGLDDVTITSVANGQLLQYDGSKWVNVAASSVGRIYSTGTGISISASNAISLASGVCTAGTYYKTTVDTYGRVTAGYYADLSAAINGDLGIGSSNPQDADYYIAQYAGGGTTTTSYHRRPHSALYSYINTKLAAAHAGLDKVGTVTKVSTGTGLTGGDITSTGTISINSTYQTYITNGNTAHGWGNHASAGYVKLNPGAAEQTLQSSISTLSKGVINLWRSSGDHYTFLGFSNGTTETYLGGIGFKSQADHNLYRKDGSNYYKIWDENNLTNSVITNLIGTTTYAAYHAAGYVKKDSDTMTGSLTLKDSSGNATFVKNVALSNTTGWARYITTLQVDGSNKFYIGAYGNYTSGGSSNGIDYAFIGVNSYNGTNLRFGSDSTLKWGTDVVLHAGNYTSYALPRSGGSSYPMTGQLYVQTGTGIGDASGNGLLVYHPTSWTGATNTQWAVGAIDSQGVIRSSATDLIHYKGGTNYTIWDASNSNLNTVPWAAQYYTYSSLNTPDTQVAGFSFYHGAGTNYASGYPYGYANIISFGESSNAIQFAWQRGVAGYSELSVRSYENDVWGDWKKIWNSGNSNKSDVAWACSTLTATSYVLFRNTDNTANAGYVGRGSNSSNDIQLYAYAGGKLHLGANNTTTITIDTAAKVGIGTATPAYKLDVNGTSGWTTRFISTNSVIYAAHNDGYGFYLGSKQSSSSYYLLNLLYGQTTPGTGGTSAFYVRADGNVGIGTTSPSYKLDVNGTVGCGAITSSGVLNITGVTSYSNGIRIHDFEGISSVWFRAVNASGYDAGMWGITAGDTGLRFRGPASTTATTPNDYVTIAHGGNVGVGVTPSYKLDVKGVTQVKGASSEYGVRIANSGNTIDGINGTSWANLYLNYSSSGNVFLGYGGGNVGIGTISSASYKLDVNSGSVGDAIRLSSSTTYSCIIYKSSNSVTWSAGKNNSDQFYFYSSSGSSTKAYLTTGGVWTTVGDQVVSSDLTLKENLTPVTYSVSDIAKARAVEFDWKDGRGHSMGSIAQDWLGIAPTLVHGEEGNMSLAYGQLALVNTILLARESESHEARIKELEARVAELEMENERLRMN